MDLNNTTKCSALYNTLPHGEWIRLLRLLPASQDTISCELFVVELSQAPSYEAISYVWGDPTNTVEIECNGGRIPITVSLHSALKCFRRLWEPRVIWADAICINQRDIKERGHQVGLMGQLYQHASRVLIWLGEDSEKIAREAFRLILDINDHFEALYAVQGDIKSLAELSKESLLLLPSRWQLVRKLFLLPWFTRVWVLQEVGLATTAVAFWGESSINWSEVVEFALLRALRADLQSADSMVHTGGLVDAFFFMWCTFDNAQTWRNERPWLQFKSRSPRNADRKHFLNLMVVSENFEATDARDHVYAFLGHPAALSTQSKRTVVEADYSIEADELMCKLTVRILEEMQSLDLLGSISHNTTSLDGTGPSWTLQLTPGNQISASILTPFPGGANRFYDASRRLDPVSRMVIQSSFHYLDDRINMAKLKLHGIAVDVVKSCSPQMVEIDFFRKSGSGMSNGIKLNPVESAWAMVTAESQSHDRMEVFAYTLLGGLNHDNSPAEENMSLHQDDFLAYCKSYFIAGHESLQHVESANSTQQAKTGDTTRFALQARRMCNNRKFFITTHGSFGLGPIALRESDVCYVLFGARVPLLLRPTSDPGHFRLIGECYVHGIMRGEAVQAMKDRRSAVEEVILI